SEHERTCMVLFYMQEMSIKEIAAVTHYNESTIRCNLHRGRERLRSFTYLQDI
ncbi:MAG: sigma-70 region 4 domain-containing protein, partial [Prevotella sp.]|nr:sigma-70 region 4 domain-containing protein [Prevotella sp.]